MKRSPAALTIFGNLALRLVVTIQFVTMSAPVSVSPEKKADLPEPTLPTFGVVATLLP